MFWTVFLCTIIVCGSFAYMFYKTAAKKGWSRVSVHSCTFVAEGKEVTKDFRGLSPEESAEACAKLNKNHAKANPSNEHVCIAGEREEDTKIFRGLSPEESAKECAQFTEYVRKEYEKNNLTKHVGTRT